MLQQYLSREWLQFLNTYRIRNEKRLLLRLINCRISHKFHVTGNSVYRSSLGLTCEENQKSTESMFTRIASRSASLQSGLRALTTTSCSRKNVVIVDGCRIPFTTAGSTYGDLIAVDLARMALKGLLTKTALNPELIEYVCMGTVIQEPRTSKYCHFY